jgi:uncharacterized protein
MRGECFVDSVAWIALLNRDDTLHTSVDHTYKQLMRAGRHYVTSSAVLNEVANALCRPRLRAAVSAFRNIIEESGRVRVEFVDEDLWERGWELYEDRPDKEWSLTDCISMVIADEYGIVDVLTNDVHFTQAGLNALIR